MVATVYSSFDSDALRAAAKTLAPEDIPTESPNLLICLATFKASESFTLTTSPKLCKSRILGTKLSPIPSIR